MQGKLEDITSAYKGPQPSLHDCSDGEAYCSCRAIDAVERCVE